jgi:hypothetical protein
LFISGCNSGEVTLVKKKSLRGGSFVKGLFTILPPRVLVNNEEYIKNPITKVAPNTNIRTL